MGWHPAGTNVFYSQNSIPREKGLSEEDKQSGYYKQKYHFTLEWKYVYEWGDDEVYFAQFVPYTYSDLIQHLQDISRLPTSSDILRINTLCKTVTNNCCPVLTITENVKSYLSYQHERTLASKSAGTRAMILNKVEKLRSRLLLKQAAARYKNPKRRSKVREDLLDPADLPESSTTVEVAKLANTAEAAYAKEREQECRSSLTSTSGDTKAPRSPQAQEGDRAHRSSASRCPSTWDLNRRGAELVGDERSY